MSAWGNTWSLCWGNTWGDVEPVATSLREVVRLRSWISMTVVLGSPIEG